MSFTTEPKLRIRRGHNITIRRCYEIGRFLLQIGYRNGDKLTREDISAAVDKIPGMDQRTHNRYIGFTITSRGNKYELPHVVKKVKGYLERLRVIESCGNGLFIFNGYLVPTPGEGSQPTITNLCVLEGSMDKRHKSALETIQQTTTNETTTTTHNPHTNQLGESNQKRVASELTPLEMTILRVAASKPLQSKAAGNVNQR